jgi:hypothetical protein
LRRAALVGANHFGWSLERKFCETQREFQNGTGLVPKRQATADQFQKIMTILPGHAELMSRENSTRT